MGLFDTFIPHPPIPCPKCGLELSGWKGKVPDNILNLWKQGHKHPIGEGTEDGFCNTGEEYLREYLLPDEFHIYGGTCKSCGYRLPIFEYGCDCECVDKVWTKTRLTPEPVEATPLEDEWIMCSSCDEAWQSSKSKQLDICPKCARIVSIEWAKPANHQSSQVSS